MKPVADRLQYCALTHKTGVLRLRAFSPPCVLRLRHRVGIIRRCWRRERSAFSFGAEKERLRARAPGAGGCKGSILLRPLSTGRKTIPRRTTCGWFWYFCHQKYKESPRMKAAVNGFLPTKKRQRTVRKKAPSAGDEACRCENRVFRTFRSGRRSSGNRSRQD